MMKKGLLWIPTALLFSLVLIQGTGAVPITLSEVFLGSNTDGNYFAMTEDGLFSTGNRALFNFDLTASGGLGQLNYGATVLETVSPTQDETDYDLSIYATPYLAYVDFFISDFLEEPSPERVRIDIESGGFVTTRSFTLENDLDGLRRVRVDLAAEGVLDYLGDGQLLAMAIAPAYGDVYNSFVLDRVRLYAEADVAPVPEPATLLLVGAGFLGLAGVRRKSAR